MKRFSRNPAKNAPTSESLTTEDKILPPAQLSQLIMNSKEARNGGLSEKYNQSMREYEDAVLHSEHVIDPAALAASIRAARTAPELFAFQVDEENLPSVWMLKVTIQGEVIKNSRAPIGTLNRADGVTNYDTDAQRPVSILFTGDDVVFAALREQSQAIVGFNPTT